MAGVAPASSDAMPAKANAIAAREVCSVVIAIGHTNASPAQIDDAARRCPYPRDPLPHARIVLIVALEGPADLLERVESENSRSGTASYERQTN